MVLALKPTASPAHPPLHPRLSFNCRHLPAEFPKLHKKKEAAATGSASISFKLEPKP